jgi:hypothetical protein
MRSWRFIAPLVLVVLGVAVLAPLLLLRGSDDADPRAGDRARDTARDGPSSPSPTASPTGDDASSTTGSGGAAIQTSSSTYFGRPFETVQITGRYPGAHGPTQLRVEIQQPQGWAPFPLPAVTRPSGEFKAYVEMGGPARYRLRIVDPQRHATSSLLELVVF